MLAVLDNQAQPSLSFDSPLPIAIIGFNQRILQTLEIAFGSCGSNCATIVPIDHAEAVIFDFDNVDSRGSWLKFRKEHPGFPTIVISAKDLVLRGAYVLTKPLRVGKIVDIFHLIQKKLATASRNIEIDESTILNTHDLKQNTAEVSGQTLSYGQTLNLAPEKHTNNTSRNANSKSRTGKRSVQSKNIVYYSPEKYLQGMIQATYKEVLNRNTAIEINVKVEKDWRSITFFPGLKKVATDFSDQRLKYICSTPLFCFDTKIVRYDVSQTKKMEFIRGTNFRLIAFEAFLWEVALWTSNGRLPKGTNLNSTYRLRRWPDFTHLKPMPHLFSMAALFSQRPTNIHLIPKLANVPQEYVYSFVSCVSALDLLETVYCNNVKVNLLRRSAEKHRTQNLFERIAGKLKTNS